MKHPLNTLRLLIEIISVIGVAEVVVMFLLPLIAPGAEGTLQAVLDAVILSALSGPVIAWRVRLAVRRTDGPEGVEGTVRPWRVLAGAAAVLVVGLCVTVMAALSESEGAHREAHARFDRLSERLVAEVSGRVNKTIDGLNSARGLFAASDVVSRGEFTTFVRTLDMERRFKGIRGIGFIQPVGPDALDAFIAAERADEAPDFPIVELPPGSEGRSPARDLYIVKFIEPQRNNLSPLGRDYAASPARLAAIDASTRSGDPILTGRVTLWQDPLGRPASVCFMPVFRKGTSPVTPEERRRDLLGWVYSPFVMDEIMAGVADLTDGRLDCEIFDGATPDASSVLFDFDHHLDRAANVADAPAFPERLFDATTTIRIGGRTWTILTRSTPRFEAMIDHSTRALLGVGGTLLSFLVAGIVWTLGASRSRAVHLATRMTADLRGAKAAAERLAEIARRTSNGILILDPQGRIEWLNEGFTRNNGYTLEEVAGKTPGEFLHGPLTDPAVVERLAAATERGEGATAELYNYAKDGRAHLLTIEVEPLRDASGSLTGFMAIETDITARVQTESELRTVTERFELATRAGGVGTWEYDVTKDRVLWDEQMYLLYGVPRDRFDGVYEAWMEKVHPDDREACDGAIRAALRDEREFDTEFRILWPDGTTHHIRAIAVVQRRADGRAVRMVGTNWDMTEVRQAEASLRVAAQALEEAQAVARMGNWSFDLRTGQVHWSKQTFALFERDERNGAPTYAEVLSDYDDESAAMLDAAVRLAVEHGTPYSLVLRTSKSGSGAQYVRGEGRSRMDDSGRVVGLYGTVTDISSEIEHADSLRTARQQAEAASRAKSEFLANMSHEIRTPLTAIMGFADVLRDEGNLTDAPPHRLQAIDAIRQGGTHLLTVINDILDLSKIEADKMIVERIETPLTGILREVESLMMPRAIGKGITLDAGLITPVPDRIVSDPTRLRQILMNLTGNAVKFTEAGRVTISAGMVHTGGRERLVIDVEDTGPGMTPEQAQRLFRAFGQADETVTRRHGGTGLGLTICRRLATLMGGDVELVRTEPGQGSCFRLTLPLEAAAGSVIIAQLDAPERETRPVTSTIEPRLAGRILLAEDGLDNQRLISFHLRKAGATVDIAGNGLIALEMLAKAAAAGERYDLLLTDMQMPDMDGYTLARTLRRQGSRLPIIALTAHAMAEDRAKCTEAGCNDYATKPIDRALLLTVCARWMGESDAAPSAIAA